jgi:hypothetical protein
MDIRIFLSPRSASSFLPYFKINGDMAPLETPGVVLRLLPLAAGNGIAKQERAGVTNRIKWKSYKI